MTRSAVILSLICLAAAGDARAQLRITSVLLPPAVVGCRTPAPGSEEIAGRIEAARVALAGVDVGSSLLRIVAGGPEIMLRAPPGAPPLAVTIFAKGPLEGEFGKVCTIQVWRPARHPLIVARSSNLLGGSVWRVDIRPLSAAPPATGPVIVERRSGEDREPDWSPGDTDWQTAFGWLCLATPPLADRGRRRHSGFAGRVALEVEVGDEGLTGGPEHDAAVTQDILRAAGLWTAACQACRLDQLLVVRINGAAWLRGGLLSWYDKTFAGAPPSPAAVETSLIFALEPDLALEAGRGPTRSGKRLEAYEEVADPALRLQQLCALSGRTAPPVLTVLRVAVCAPQSLPARDVARISVMFRPTGLTWCGSTPDIIGCRASRTLTEFNSRDYRFILGDVGHNTVGRGPTETPFLLVLAHEMGHWIGLPHIDGGASLMGSSLSTARCIDDRTVARLSSGQGRDVAGVSAFRVRPLRRRRTEPVA